MPVFCSILFCLSVSTSSTSARGRALVCTIRSYRVLSLCVSLRVVILFFCLVQLFLIKRAAKSHTFPFSRNVFLKSSGTLCKNTRGMRTTNLHFNSTSYELTWTFEFSKYCHGIKLPSVLSRILSPYTMTTFECTKVPHVKSPIGLWPGICGLKFCT